MLIINDWRWLQQQRRKREEAQRKGAEPEQNTVREKPPIDLGTVSLVLKKMREGRKYRFSSRRKSFRATLPPGST